ncbi:MAG: adenylate kinase family protein [Candidatus Caldarchaeum sp.]
MIIWISGSPGVGKTTVGRMLAARLGYDFVDVPRLIREEELVESFDEVRQAWTVDPKALSKHLVRRVVDKCVLASHIVLPLKKRPVKCIILRLNPLVLKKRLERRGYDFDKIAENVEAEFVGVVYQEAVAALGSRRVYQLDTTGRGVKATAGRCLRVLQGIHGGDEVDWLSSLPEHQLEKVLGFLARKRRVDFLTTRSPDLNSSVCFSGL